MMLLWTGVMMAVPAHPGTTTVQQPDGSTVTLRLVGDEWLHFHTTADGYSVVRNDLGYYVYAELQDGQLQATAQVAHDADGRSAQEQAFLAGWQKFQTPAMPAAVAERKARVEGREQQKRSSRRVAEYNYSNFKGLVILVEFNDKSFSRADYHDIADGMINQENYDGYYTASGSKVNFTGSVRDYFSDNSGGKFQPEFDVYGPYKIDFSQYDAHGTDNAAELIYAALDSADVDINYADYDRDGNGEVDLVYFIFAGNGANYGDNDQRLFWPHRSVVYNPHATSWWSWQVKKDGVQFGDYASSVELFGYTKMPQTVTIDGIGTICHEFSHVLGLPDFYDTDYDGSGGESIHPNLWSLMAGGCYENTSRTPVGYSLYERWSVGFLDDDAVETISGEGSFQLEPLYSSYKGYRINTPVNNEYFLFENRQRSSFKWDAYLPGSGMLVHRVDKTSNNVWNSNTVNSNPSHNYYEVVRAAGPQRDRTGMYTDSASDLFPGSSRVTSLHSGTSPANLKSWAGRSTKWGLFDIQLVNGVVSFEVRDALTLVSIALPATATVGAGAVLQLDATPTPDYAEFTLTWSSSNSEVATVDANGLVLGIAPGTTTITVNSNNGLTATCEVTVETTQTFSIGEFKQLDADADEVLLQLDQADVLFASGNTAFVRDASGAIMFTDMALGLKTNDVVSGTVYARLVEEDRMLQAVGTSKTFAAGLTITSGGDPQPREVQLADLTTDDYSDFVLVKAAQLVLENKAVYAVQGDFRVRYYNQLGVTGISLKDYNGKYFDLPVIYGTGKANGQLVDMLYIYKQPVEVPAPSGISVVRADSPADARCYNLQGQRVSSTWKGLTIRNGRKYVVK